MGRGSLGGSLVPLPLRLANLRYAPVLPTVALRYATALMSE